MLSYFYHGHTYDVRLSMLPASGRQYHVEKGTFKSEYIAGRAVSVAATQRPKVGDALSGAKRRLCTGARSLTRCSCRDEAQSYAHAPPWLYRERENEIGREECKVHAGRKKRAEDDEWVRNASDMIDAPRGKTVFISARSPSSSRFTALINS